MESVVSQQRNTQYGNETLAPRPIASQATSIQDGIFARYAEIERLKHEVQVLRLQSYAEPRRGAVLCGQEYALDSTVSYAQGHLYQSTYVSGGTNFQGDVYGQIHIHQNNNIYQDGRAGARILLESHESMSAGPSAPYELRNEQASEDKLHNSLLRIINLSTDIAESPSSSQAKRCMRDLTDLLTNISTCEKSTLNTSSRLCQDCSDELLDRTVSIFQLSAELRTYQMQSQHVSMLSCSPILDHKSSIRREGSSLDPENRTNRDKESLAPRLASTPGQCGAATTLVGDGGPSINRVMNAQKTCALHNRRTPRMLRPTGQHLVAENSTISALSSVVGDKFVRRSSTASWQTQLGRVDFSTETKRSIPTKIPGTPGQAEDETFSAKIIITPAADRTPSRQLIFRCRQEQSSTLTSILAPSLEVRNIRPYDSEIFRIAQTGSVNDLRHTLASGMGSVRDCSPGGSSLLSVRIWMPQSIFKLS